MADTRRVAGRYELEQQLGSGGTGVVWSAIDVVLERRVAIKQVAVPLTVSADERDRLSARVIREARAAARLNHSGATTVFDVFEADGSTYIVMELVDGPTLKDVVADHGPLPPSRAAELGLALLATLEAAHAFGIVHRDVKPANVMLPPGGGPKLTDFGIAWIVDDPSLTATGLVLGSPAFMSPEQAQGGEVGSATDLWALGATLYFAVEGVLPFERERSMATLHAIVREEPRPMRRAGALGPVIARLLTKDPTARPDAVEARRLLERAAAAGDATVVDEEPTRAWPAVAAEPVEEPVPTEVVRDAREPVTSHRSARVLAMVGVLVFLAVLAVLLIPRGGGDGQVAGDGAATEAPAEPPTDDDVGGAAAGEETAAETPSAPPTATQDDGGADEPSPTEAAPATPPEGWTTYDPEAPYSVAYPQDWQVERIGGNRTDLADPSTGAYLRIDWTDDPAGDPYADWEAYEEQFAREHQDYERIRLERTEFRGRDAAIWEYTYRAGGTPLHAYNLNIGGEQYAYALNWQTHADDWEAMLGHWEVFTDTFQPAS